MWRGACIAAKSGASRPNLPTPTVTLASFDRRRITTAPVPVLSRPVCVVRIRFKARMPPGCQPSPTGSTGVTVCPESLGDRVRGHAIGECDAVHAPNCDANQSNKCTFKFHVGKHGIPEGQASRTNYSRRHFSGACIATKSAVSCPSWVRIGHSAISARCPLWPRTRTQVRHPPRSEKCQ